MELIKSAARRTRVSEVVYILLNVAYAALILLLILGFEGRPYFAYLVVLLSKWRVFAVRPRFWVANIQSNLLDTLVGVSAVTLIWQNTGNLTYQLVTTALFVLWLVLLKPRSKRFWVVLQGGVGQFVALMALFSIAHSMHVAAVTAFSWLIGFVVAKHIIHVFDEEHEDVTLAITWGIVVAEIGWLTHYWTIAYTPFRIPQVAIIVSLLGYMTLVVYNYLYHREDNKRFWNDLSMPILFSLAGIALLLLLFNNFNPTGL